MKRRDRELTELEEFRYVLDHSDVVHIAMHDGDGLYLLPMNYGYTLEESGKLTLYVHGSLEGKKWDLIRENGQVAVEIDCDHALIEGKVPCQYGYGYASILGSGTIEILDSPEEKAEAMAVLMKTMTGKDFSFNEKLVSIVTVARIAVDSYTGKRRPVKEGEKIMTERMRSHA